MERQKSRKSAAGIVVWLLYRLVLLNAFILISTYTLSFLRAKFESTEILVIKFPFEFYITAFFLTNLVYIIGNIFEIIYLRLWNKKVEIKLFEKKFFTGSIVMLIFIIVIGVFRYLIFYYDLMNN